MVKLGCVNDDCEAESVELHFDDVEALKEISVQCGCGWPRVPFDSGLEPNVEAAIVASCFRFPEAYEYGEVF